MSPSQAGYSGKPVWRKLGLAAGMRVHVAGAPDDYATLVGLDADAIALVGARARFDLAHLFADDATRLARSVVALAARLPADGVLWVSWPKKSSGIVTDITEDVVRAIALPLGLVDNKVCAIDATWSALKLVWRRELRAGKPMRRR
ncbi:DUF3052 domain-containing protein [Dokdonella sp.]|uniref:DUF3052 domain-containing protein n=1 Tax=Dokdonella sp. TaxID=2291710 RepID=UPI0037848CCD